VALIKWDCYKKGSRPPFYITVQRQGCHEADNAVGSSGQSWTAAVYGVPAALQNPTMSVGPAYSVRSFLTRHSDDEASERVERWVEKGTKTRTLRDRCSRIRNVTERRIMCKGRHEHSMA